MCSANPGALPSGAARSDVCLNGDGRRKAAECSRELELLLLGRVLAIDTLRVRRLDEDELRLLPVAIEGEHVAELELLQARRGTPARHAAARFMRRS